MYFTLLYCTLLYCTLFYCTLLYCTKVFWIWYPLYCWYVVAEHVVLYKCYQYWYFSIAYTFCMNYYYTILYCSLLRLDKIMHSLYCWYVAAEHAVLYKCYQYWYFSIAYIFVWIIIILYFIVLHLGFCTHTFHNCILLYECSVLQWPIVA